MKNRRTRLSPTSTGQWFCPACRRDLEMFAPGPRQRPNARCPHCHALERHRYLAILLEAYSPAVRAGEFVLEVAPTPPITRILRQSTQGTYVGIDIDPEADGRRVQVVADLTNAPFRDGMFDVSICFHVFEHIADDRSAMKEYARLISPTGVGFIQNPWRATGPTVEDPEATPEERERRFGQADHVRVYGQDFEERLRSSGLNARRIVPESVLSPRETELMGIDSHPIWIVNGADSVESRLSDAQFEADLQQRVRTTFANDTWSPEDLTPTSRWLDWLNPRR